MKIAIFADIFLPHVDGVTNSLVHLIKEFEKLGNKVLVVAPKFTGSEKIKLKGVKIIFLPSIPAVVYPEIMLGLFSRELFNELRGFSPDVVHLVGPGSIGSMGIFYSKLVNIPSVAAFHGYFMEPEYLKLLGIKKHGVSVAQKMLWVLAKTFYDRANIVITPSNFVKKDLFIHEFSRPIEVISNAIDFSSINLDQEKYKQFIKKYSLSGCKIALYVGRVSLEKNIETLIRSFVKTTVKIPSSRFLIVGNGPDLERLRDLVVDLNLEKHVIFVGEIKNTDLVKIGVFKLAKVFVTASHSEVQPISIIEAMNFSLPIIAANSRGLTEMIQENGYLLDGNDSDEFSNKITKILFDDKLQKEMSAKSKDLAKKYSIKTSAKQYILIYKQLISQKTSRPSVGSFLKSKIGRNS